MSLGLRASLIVLLTLVAAAPARASDEPPPAAPETSGLWQGASWGFDLRLGPSVRSADDDVTPTPFGGIGFRICTLLTLIDAEAFVTTAGFSRTNAAGDYDLRRTTLGVDVRVHPLFIRHLQGGLGDRIAAGIHLALGGGIDLLSIRGPGYDRTDPAFAFAVGLGVDLPLTEPNGATWSVWLGLGWRARFVGFSKSAPGLRDMDEHQALLSVSLRFHDLTGVRWAVPPELDDIDR